MATDYYKAKSAAFLVSVASVPVFARVTTLKFG